MSGTSRAGSYRTLLADRRIARTFVLSAVGRAGYAMLPLLVLFTVNQATHSFRLAALVMSCYGFTTLLMPLKSRLIDRHGARIVLPILGIGLFVVLSTMTGVAAARVTWPGWWLTLGVAIGLAAPPLGPAMRSQWRILAGDRLTLAYSLDAVTEELLWLLGPVVAGAVVAAGPAWHGLMVPPILIVVGCLALACSPAHRAVGSPVDDHPPRSRGTTALRHGGLWPVLVLMGSFGAAGSLLATGIAATATAKDVPAFAGLAEAAIAVGAISGGLLWGRCHPGWSWTRSAAVLLVPWSVLVAAAGAVGLGLPMLGLLLVVGAVGAPLWILAYLAADQAVPKIVRTEANTWVTTTTNLGTTAGTALAGILSSFVIRMPLFVAAGVAALAAAAMTIRSRAQSAASVSTISEGDVRSPRPESAGR